MFGGGSRAHKFYLKFTLKRYVKNGFLEFLAYIFTLNEKFYPPKTVGPNFFSYLDFMDPIKTGVGLFQCVTSKKSINVKKIQKKSL